MYRKIIPRYSQLLPLWQSPIFPLFSLVSLTGSLKRTTKSFQEAERPQWEIFRVLFDQETIVLLKYKNKIREAQIFQHLANK